MSAPIAAAAAVVCQHARNTRPLPLARSGLAYNELTSSLPSELAQLRALTGLLAPSNRLNGSLSGVGNYRALRKLCAREPPLASVDRASDRTHAPEI